jgi:hypothetical protein
MNSTNARKIKPGWGGVGVGTSGVNSAKDGLLPSRIIDNVTLQTDEQK